MFYFTPYSNGVLNSNIEAKATSLGLILGAAGAVKKSNWDSLPAVAVANGIAPRRCAC